MSSRVLRFFADKGVLVVVAFGLLYACSDAETPSTSFAKQEDAVKKGAMGAGKWLPSWLPTSATEIREAHSIDTNLVWLEFQTPNALNELGPQCRQISQLAMQDVLPTLSKGFPRAMRNSRELLGKQTEAEASQCTDEYVERDWIAVRLKGSALVYAWTRQ